MSCCPPDSLPPLYTASASAPTKIGSVDVFFYDNPASSNLVLVFPDVFGPDCGRTKENCVKLSAFYKVVLVDLAPPYIVELSEIPEWAKARPIESLVPKINDVVRHYQSAYKLDKIAAMGYCWGAWIVAKYSSVPSNVLVAGIGFHPARRIEDLFHGRGSAAKIAETILVPQFFLPGGNDPPYLKSGQEADKTLQARGIPARVRDFPQVLHGWVNRGDLNDPVVAEGFRAAWDDEALPFLRQYFAAQPRL
ncbi:hypothetical protein AC1031_018942 [Aphanomyces cochlioides]|nr:hypothetical protein AC1031_018942 [Aphanomyces cochlioides]